jgi:Flp pilus assembly protein TadD
MNQRHFRFMAGAIIGAILLGGGLLLWKRTHTRAEWVRSIPLTPDLTGKTAELRSRLTAARIRAESRPGDAGAVAEFTLLCLANGFDHEAEQGLRILVALERPEPRWPHFLAKLLAGYGRIDEALTWHAKAVALAPDYVSARIKWADALLRHNEPEAAAHEYREALTRSPGQVHALVGLARIELEKGQLEAAREKLSQAIAAEPTFAGAHELMVTVLEKLGDSTAAEVERVAARDLGISRELDDPWAEEIIAYCHDPYRLRVLASAIAFAKRTDKALPLLKRALEVDPKDARTHALLGKLYLGEKDFERARTSLTEAIALDARVPEPYLDLAQISKEQRVLKTGMSVLRGGLAACPDSGRLHHEYALALAAQGEVAEASRHFREAQRLQPGLLAAYQDFALFCFRHGNDREGWEALEAARKKAPNDREILTLLTRYHIHTRNESAAEEFSRQARRAGVPSAVLAEVREAFQRQFGRALDVTSEPKRSPD